MSKSKVATKSEFSSHFIKMTLESTISISNNIMSLNIPQSISLTNRANGMLPFAHAYSE